MTFATFYKFQASLKSLPHSKGDDYTKNVNTRSWGSGGNQLRVHPTHRESILKIYSFA